MDGVTLVTQRKQKREKKKITLLIPRKEKIKGTLLREREEGGRGREGGSGRREEGEKRSGANDRKL